MLQSLPSSSDTTSPRGIKRSRSPDTLDPAATSDQPRKRGKSTKLKTENANSPPTMSQTMTSPPSTRQTPQPKPHGLVPESPSHASPPQSTPSSSRVVKPLPTSRDHTTDQLNPEKDEYLPREIDEDGEKKITAMGEPLGGRKFTVETFTLQTRGAKLFMLATRCAQSLTYRDSYLLFHKNRSLYKIVANNAEKEEMIQKNIIPNAYRSRGIAVVTARSMFRQFGSRLVKDGRKVRDDYFEAKIRKQGFTEDDPAWAKRPGEVKHKEPVSNDISSIGANAMNQLGRGQVIYQDGGYQDVIAPDLSNPVSQKFNIDADDMMARDYGDSQRPRQDLSGVPYTDRTQANTEVEVVNQAAQATQFNSQLNQQSSSRYDFLMNCWQKEHPVEEIPLADSQTASGVQIEQQYTSPHAARSTSAAISHPLQQPTTISAHIPNPSMQSNTFTRPLNPMHSPISNPHAMLPAQPQRTQPYGYGAQQPTSNMYNTTSTNNMWTAPQIQASPMQPPPSIPPYQHSTFGPSPSPHPMQQSPHPTNPIQPQMNQTLAQSHGIGLGGYQSSGGIPGMQTPLSQNYMTQQRAGYGNGMSGQVRPGGGFQLNPLGSMNSAQQQYMQQQQSGMGVAMGNSGQGWNQQMMGGSGQQQSGQSGQGAQGQQHMGQSQQQQGGWGNY